MKVEGSFDSIIDSDRGNSSKTVTIIVVATATASVTSFLLILVLLITIIATMSKLRRRRYQPIVSLRNGGQLLEMQYLTPYNLPSTLRVHKVGKDCELRQYLTKTLSAEFKRGHTYYEFTNDIENILEGKEVLVQGEDKKWFQLSEETAAVMYGRGISRDSFGDQYRVFVQSFGSGTRYLPKGSWILYNYEDQVEPDALPLVPVCLEYFAHKVIDSEEGYTIQQFCTQNGLNQKAFNVFLTVEHLPEGMRDQPPRDVILMNRESSELFTGPLVRKMLDPRNGGEMQQSNEKWKVFVLLGRNKQGFILQKNSEVLYQDSRYRNGKYSVLEVDEDSDCVRMSKFIETKLGCQYKYEDGKAFYEAEREEDLLYCKKILRPQKEELNREELELQSLVEYFYAIDGVPAKGVKLRDLHHMKVFIQNTSQGSRCLRKGEKLLYLKEYVSSSDLKLQVDPDPDSSSEDEHRHA